jgi:CheY-like chemotaxis protein
MSSFPGPTSWSPTPSEGATQVLERDAFYAGAVAGATALVVEDDVSSALALKALLERGRLSVVAANTGFVALDALDERRDIGIVLMDIGMPVMDGYQTIAAIRGHPRHVALPIIAVTGFGASERARCFAAGASGFVRKPIDTSQLLAAIGMLLGSPHDGAEQLWL